MKKQCSKCGECKPLTDFHVQPLGRHGRRANCKTCMAQYAKSWATKSALRLMPSAARLKSTEERIALVAKLAEEREQLTTAGDREGLIRIASQYAEIGAKSTAQQILAEV